MKGKVSVKYNVMLPWVPDVEIPSLSGHEQLGALTAAEMRQVLDAIGNRLGI